VDAASYQGWQLAGGQQAFADVLLGSRRRDQFSARVATATSERQGDAYRPSELAAHKLDGSL